VNSRERVLAALHHQEGDRIPVDLDGMRSSGILAITLNKLQAYLGEPGYVPQLYDIMQQLGHPSEAVLQRFHVDVRPLPRASVGLDPANPSWKPWILPDGTAALAPSGLETFRQPSGDLFVFDDEQHPILRMPEDGIYFEPYYMPLGQATTVAEMEAYQPPVISDAELSWLRTEAKKLRASSDKAILGQTGLNLYEHAQRVRGWEQFMVDLGGEPKLVEALLQRIADTNVVNLDRYLEAVGEYIDIVQLGDDLGTQAGPQMSTRMYRKLIKPYQKQVFQFVKAKSGLPVMLHCCGGVYPLLPDLIEVGVDILNPVQFNSVGMEPVRLKQEFGKDFVFWGGGADTQAVLPNATPAEVRDHVHKMIDIFAPGGGFVFNQVHNIQNVPPENIVALFAAAEEFGAYA
jgi:uroporphyrinogen decarboxylase